MKRRILSIILGTAMTAALLAGCGGSQTAATTAAAPATEAPAAAGDTTAAAAATEAAKATTEGGKVGVAMPVSYTHLDVYKRQTKYGGAVHPGPVKFQK